ncbi:MAG: hypothetical protein AAB116_25860 [Candidatus Poribacteria bacterium]
MLINRIIFLIINICFLAACNNKPGALVDGPKHRLNEYISKSFAIRSASDRNQLLEYLTGDAKRRLLAWSDEQFRQAFMDSKRQFVKLIWSEVKPASTNEVSITYELSYFDQGKGHDAIVTAKKLCNMTMEQGKWMIKDVRNIKELIEYRNEMSLP